MIVTDDVNHVRAWWHLLFEFLVELLPIPNPYIPEEHEPWCPYSLVQLRCKDILFVDNFTQLFAFLESI